MFNIDWAKRTHKGLRRWILYVVKGGPKSGAEIMDTMESNLQGWWRPSPGSIYPLLDTMVKEGELSRSDDKRYSLTEAGRIELERTSHWPGRELQSPRSVEEVVELMSSYVSYLEDIAAANKDKLGPESARIGDLSERLRRLGS